MKNLYRELKNRQQKEINAFPLGACFSKEQFADMMQNWGLSVNDTDNIYSIGFGCYIRKSDHAAFHEMLDRHEREQKAAIAADKTGNGYIYQMFLAELADHEYCMLVQNGFKIIEVGNERKFLYGDFPKAEESHDKIFLRACAKGSPVQDGARVTVSGKSYEVTK